MNLSLYLFILIPAVAFIISLFFKNYQEKIIAAIVQTVTVAYIIAAIVFGALWLVNGTNAISERTGVLYKTEGFEFVLHFYYDAITMVYSIVGSLLFFLVARFSHYYMHRDEGFKRFFNTLLLFLVGFNTIIFSGNFETLFVGWEIIGLASFLLIAFYRNRYLPVKNAFKVLSIYRISDIALILAMWMMHHLTHQNINFTQLAESKIIAATLDHSGMAYFIAGVIALAAIAKSAQVPFTTWLPRAMEGPTSSSAIFYGSLSVHVGVFILLRTYPFWQDMLWVKILLIAVGVLTSIIATLIARVQPTVKTQIAYSSSAQIGIIFVEVALGLHWLALLHFAGNAFLRTYQLLVSPSVLNYLVHHQYFHHTANTATGASKFKNSIYALGIKEWGLDNFQFKFLWMPFKWVGRQLGFLNGFVGFFITFMLILGSKYLLKDTVDNKLAEALPIIFMSVALLFILSAFASRGSAFNAWRNLILAHFLIIYAVVMNNDAVLEIEMLMYVTGVIITFVAGQLCLFKINNIDNDIALNKFHGYVYEQKTIAFIFLVATIGLIGFPVTAAFIGIDVFFTHVGANQYALITLLALCFFFLEMAAIRIYLRIFLGPHKKLNHPIAFRTS